MTRVEQRWVKHLLGAFAPSGGSGLSPLPDEVDYVSAFARMRRHATPLAALGMRLALWIAALAPMWLWGRLTTVSKLASERRSQLLRELLRHRTFAVRELTLLLKLAATMALLGTPSVRARSGYDSVQAPALVESGLRVRLPLLHERTEPSAIDAATPSALAVASANPLTAATADVLAVPATDAAAALSAATTLGSEPPTGTR